MANLLDGLRTPTPMSEIESTVGHAEGHGALGNGIADVKNGNPQEVIIIGAGLTGLLTARGLQEAGIPFTIWEARDDSRTGDWSMAMHWSLPMLKEILGPDAFARIQEVQTDPSYDPPDYDMVPLFHGGNGEVLKNVPMSKWHRLKKRLADIKCSEAEGIVTAIFEDGAAVSGTCLIGADGSRSRVRQILLGPEKSAPKPAPYIATRIVAKYPTAEQALTVRSLHPQTAIAFHPDGIFCFIGLLDAPDPNRPEDWTFQLMTSWRKPDGFDTASITLADVQAKTARFCEPFRSANAWVPEDSKVYINNVTYWEPVPWDNRKGMVTLAGDAAHAMSFHRGQGLNHSVCDVSKYIAAVRAVHEGEAGLEDAISAYDAEMIARAGEEVRVSTINTEMVHQWEKLMSSPFIQRGLEPNK